MKNRTINTKVFFERTFLISLLIITLFLHFIHIYLNNFIATLVLVLDIYALIKYRKSTMLFILFLSILFFDYSVIITKYYYNIEQFKNLYSQIAFSKTMYIGIFSLFLVHAISL